MKIKNLVIIINVLVSLAIFSLGLCIGLAICDSSAKENATNSEYLDMLELCYEHDYNCEIKEMDYHNLDKGTFTWLVIDNGKDEPYLITFELKKFGFMTYGWEAVNYGN